MRSGLLLALALLVLAPRAAQAQPRDADLGDTAAFLTLFPELRALPNGSGLAPGLRVTYQSAAAATAGGASGAGIIQYDVVHVDGIQVHAYQTSYADGGAGLYPLATGHVSGLPGLGTFWMNPTVLQRAEAVATTGLSVTRSQRQVGTQTVAVVRFEATGQGRSVWEFDQTTGLLVFDSIATGGGAAQLTLVGARTLQLPWAVDRAPGWVRPGAELRYSGVDATTIPAAGTTQIPAAAQIQITQAGARWSLSTLAVTIAGMSQGSSTGITGSGQLLGALWLPRSALAANLPATPVTVDMDPTTGATISLVRGAAGIQLQLQTAASRTTWSYDPVLGVLAGIDQQVQLSTALRQTTLARATGGSDLGALAQGPEVPDDPAPAGGNGPGGNGPGGNGTGNGAAGNGSAEPAAKGDGCSTAQGEHPGALALCVAVLVLVRRRPRGTTLGRWHGGGAPTPE